MVEPSKKNFSKTAIPIHIVNDIAEKLDRKLKLKDSDESDEEVKVA